MLDVKLWRCAKCGKWSHAIKRPRHHLATNVIRDDGYERHAQSVWCGPFEMWSAVKVDNGPENPSTRIGDVHQDFGVEYRDELGNRHYVDAGGPF